MSEFQLPIDIWNRACQHCGVTRISSTTEDSKQASEIAAVYGKLRQAELQERYWTFAIKKQVLRPISTGSMVLVPALWSQFTTYFFGSIVSDALGNVWESVQPNNLNNDPLSTPAWVPYFGPMSVDVYNSTLSYFAGELVYTYGGDGTNRVYKSLQNDNADNPATATAWDATVTYFKNQVVTVSSTAYMSLTDLNLNNNPSTSPAAWAVGTTYALGAHVAGSDGYNYVSLSNGNIGHNPVSDAGVHWQNTNVLVPWTSVFTGGSGSIKWLQIGGAEFSSGVTLSRLNPLYPVGAGPSSQGTTRNVFVLPANFLRQAPRDPKAGAWSVLGAPTNLIYEDWIVENGFLISGSSEPIVLRFVADIVDVRLMDAMFCEGLGARIALEVVETLTNSTAKKQGISREYDRVMGRAKIVNATENDAIEEPLDDLIACRA